MKSTFFILAVSLLFSRIPAEAEEWHVAQRFPGAADGNSGSITSPWLTIGAAVARVKPGDVVILHDGVYREAIKVTANGRKGRPIRFAAAPNERVVIAGTDILTDWTPSGEDPGAFSTPWPHRFITWSPTGTHPADDYHRLVGRAEQVFIEDYPLKQVLTRKALSRGSFYVDLDAGRLYVHDFAGRDLAAKTAPRVEASVRPVLWESAGDFIEVCGVILWHAANYAQQGAVTLAGSHCALVDCAVKDTNADGVGIKGEHTLIQGCLMSGNGMNGFEAAKAHNLLMRDCIIRNNNVKGFNRGWGGGGCKLALSRDVIIERCIFEDNHGTGVWFDIGNEDCTVRNCLVADNENAGLFYEISYGLHALDNVFTGNGFAETPGAWGADGGLSLSSSQKCLIERNLIACNKEGLQFREQKRTTPRIGDPAERPIWNQGHIVRNNIIAFNRDAQVAGWFAAGDERHWPIDQQKGSAGGKGPKADIAAEYLAKPGGAWSGEPRNLAELALNLRGNWFALLPGQTLYQWGCKWERNKIYMDVAAVQAGLGFEKGSQSGPAPFADSRRRNFTVPAGTPIAKFSGWPHGKVPGVTLPGARRAFAPIECKPE